MMSDDQCKDQGKDGNQSGGDAGHLHDIELLRKSESRYKALSNELESILDHIPGLIFYKDKNNNFIRVNKFLADAHKKRKKDLEGVSLYDLYPNYVAEKYYQDDLDVISSCKAKMNIEESWETADGLRWVSTSKIPFINDEGEVIGVIGISIDVTERKQAEQVIQGLIHRLETEKGNAQQNALTDSLTGIANRRHFDDTLKREFTRAKRSKNLLSMIMLDIDHFKKFNDRFGHLAGDSCLRMVADALQAAVGRAPDFVARYGGDEFVVILPDTGECGATVVAERIRKSVETLSLPYGDRDTAGCITVSLGVITIHPDRSIPLDKVIDLVDRTLYCAKAGGRNRLEVAVGTTNPQGASQAQSEFQSQANS